MTTDDKAVTASPRKGRGIAFHNTKPKESTPANAPTDAVKAEFARRLYRAMMNKGWNQSELARQAALYTPEGRFGRDSVSCYVRGVNVPGPVHLRALCQALDVAEEELLPSHGVPNVDRKFPAFEMKDLGDGAVWMRINQEIPWEKAMRIMQIMQE